MHLEAAHFPCEGAIDAVRARFAGCFDELERCRVDVHARTEKCFGERPRLVVGYCRPGRVFRDFVREPGHLAAWGYAGAEFFLLPRTVPAVGPSPQAHACAKNLVRPL